MLAQLACCPGENGVQVLQRIMSSETGYLSVQQGARVALMVNSLGSVTPNELQIAARAAIRLLQETFKASLPLAAHALHIATVRPGTQPIASVQECDRE